MLIDHPASDWFHYYQSNTHGASWAEFLVAVQQRFDPNYYENYVGLLSKLTQTSSVLDYQTAFESLLNKVSGVPETTLISIFVAGLKQPVQRELNLRNPTTLQSAFALARELSACHQEAAVTFGSSPRRPWLNRPAPSTAGILPTPPLNTRTTPEVAKPPDRPSPSNLPVVTVSAAERAERSKKGGGVKRSGIATIIVGGVSWRSWDRMTRRGHLFEIDLFMLEVHGPDIVLGVQWLQTLGKVAHDYAKLTMEFLWNGTTVTLRGDMPKPRPVSFNQLRAMLASPTPVDLYELVPSPSPPSTTTSERPAFPPDLPGPITALLESHAAVFGTPIGLPPPRFWDHRIHLTLGTQPINVFYLETDASNSGVGAVLLQQGHPLAFFSKKLGPRRRLASTYHKELYAIVEAVQKWRQYLLGREFVIRSDQRSLKELLHQVVQTPDQQFYIRKLMGYKFRIEYKAGSTNRAADALSRRGDDTELAALFTTYSRPLPKLLDALADENTKDPELQQLHAAVTAWTAKPDFSVHGGHNESIGMSPFQALYGRPPPSIFPTMAVRSRIASVEDLLRERADLLTDLKTHLAKMRQHMVAQANSHRRDVSYAVGDLVLLKLRPYRQHSVARPLSSKLSRRYYGPFPVLERVGPVAYRLQLPPNSRIHNVFHVSLLRPFIQQGPSLPPVALPADFFKGCLVSVPLQAVAARTILVDGHPQDQWLIRWSDGGPKDSTWEPVEDIRRHYPDLALEDEAVVNPGGVDTVEVDVPLVHANPSVAAAPHARPKRTIQPPKRYQDYI
ncbi:unnamed protein product [Cuscuta campestris]|uniref:Ty3 transposon capsid-like protein domain-containing protein n=1 Tax=Cuscuta campestris TaxID=132261 RepID=A0A484N095_9ASTE|nr:unnamed protein product [Cuscuta campestris]